MPPHQIQQPMLHSTNVSTPYYQVSPQHQVTFTQMNPDLQLAFQNCESDIRKHGATVVVNWIVIGLHVLGVVATVVISIGFTSMLDLICEIQGKSRTNAGSSERFQGYEGFGGYTNDASKSIENCKAVLGSVGIGVVLVIAMLILLYCSILIFIHYQGIVAYRERKAGTMNCVFICFVLFLVLSVLFTNYIGIVEYAYLTYASHRLKMLLAERSKIEDQMKFQSINISSQPIYPH
eukprot:CAMPEP_0176438918 /NCGR_PEP_ID=MMETSP0127-20121128/19604_1 /TAXON_ID=938130 /ORGANISM="Platyophrya macrostoma, Strain WH" /LENGTH=234 /DNA_ID=CAMNT_0017823029 /DNA_START=102 /DNA_END=806 /DNA_ORIENTATION=+